MCICFERFFSRDEWVLGWGDENGRVDRKLKKCFQLDLLLPTWKNIQLEHWNTSHKLMPKYRERADAVQVEHMALRRNTGCQETKQAFIFFLSVLLILHQFEQFSGWVLSSQD